MGKGEVGKRKQMKPEKHFHAADLLSNRARLTPEREALVELETGNRLTYAALNTRVNQAANFLRDALGIGKGDRVSIIAKNCIAYIDLFYGVAKIGAILSPYNWRSTVNELVYMINDCEPKVLIFELDFEDVVKELQAEVGVEHFVSISGTAFDGALVYEDLLADASLEEPERPDLDSESPYCILYTSGTTGKPKGAILPHRQVLFNCINTASSWGLTEDDISPVYTPLYHAGGLFAFLTPLLYLGGKIILARDFDPVTSLQWILEERCTVILGVPTLFQMWMDADEFEATDFSHVHFFISGGAPCPPQLIAAWREKKDVVFRQGYGLTEVGPNCFSMTDEDSVLKTGSVGRPIMHSHMRLVNPKTMKDVPVGESGELWIYGPHVCAGYWNNEVATAESIVDGWFRTGDMAHRDEDGFFYIDGRYKDMIKSGGENIYAAEVEAAFREHPAIKDCALIGKPDMKWGEVGLLICILENGQTVTEEALCAFVAEKLARFKIPKEYIFTETLPYTAYGKVEKANLRKKFLEQLG